MLKHVGDPNNHWVPRPSRTTKTTTQGHILLFSTRRYELCVPRGFGTWAPPTTLGVWELSTFGATAQDSSPVSGSSVFAGWLCDQKCHFLLPKVCCVGLPWARHPKKCPFNLFSVTYRSMYIIVYIYIYRSWKIRTWFAHSEGHRLRTPGALCRGVASLRANWCAGRRHKVCFRGFVGLSACCFS